jgi:tricorn protease
VENHSVPPDIEVEDDPKAVRAGHDPQLEKGVEVMELVKKRTRPGQSRTVRPIPTTTKLWSKSACSFG